MKSSLLILAAILSSSALWAEDSIDRLDQKYQTIATEGLLKVHASHIAELENEKAKAMSASDLTQANRAAEKIKALQIEIAALQEKLEKIKEGTPALPQNDFYKMTFTSGKTGTEKGAKIPFSFERLPLTNFAGDKLFLVVTAAKFNTAETPHEIFVFDESTGKEIGTISGLNRGQTKRIPLSLPPSEVMKLAIAVKGENALHLMAIEKGVPEVYLEIDK